MKAVGDVIQVRMLGSGEVWSSVCVLMVGAVIIGMKKELNDKKKDVGRHIMEDLTTDARAITEGARSNAEACSDTTDHFTGAAVSFRSFAGEWCEFKVPREQLTDFWWSQIVIVFCDGRVQSAVGYQRRTGLGSELTSIMLSPSFPC